MSECLLKMTQTSGASALMGQVMSRQGEARRTGNDFPEFITSTQLVTLRFPRPGEMCKHAMHSLFIETCF